MNLDKIRPKIETDGLLNTKTKNCQTLFNKTYTKPQETLEFKPTQSKETVKIKDQSRFTDAGWLDLQVWKYTIVFIKKNRGKQQVRNLYRYF